MRAAVILAVATLGLCSALPARAETPEQLYFATRNAAIAKITAATDAYVAMPAEPRAAKGEAMDNMTALDTAERTKLEQQLRAIVGPVAIQRFVGSGALNLDALSKGDQGFGTLDGLTFTSADKKASVIVTTASIFQHWLVEHKNWWGKGNRDIPQQPAKAVKENGFYTQALVTDSAIIGFTVLPVRKPAGITIAFAMIGGRTQDAMPTEADEIYFAVARGTRVFIGQSRSIDPVGPIAACEAAHQAITDHPPDQDAKERMLQAKFLSCFAAQAKQQPTYAGALRTAQRIADSVALR